MKQVTDAIAVVTRWRAPISLRLGNPFKQACFVVSKPTVHKSRLRKPLFGALIVALLLGAILYLNKGVMRLENLHAFILQSGRYAVAVYVFCVVIAELLGFPRMWGILIAGMIWGPIGMLFSIVADLLSAIIAYKSARYLGRDVFDAILARRPNAERMLRLLAERRGFVMIMLLRICPIAHYTFISYAAGLIGVRVPAYMLGTGLGILPGAIVYTCLGTAVVNANGVMLAWSVGAVIVTIAATMGMTRNLIRQEHGSQNS